jgi:hypothetical protein
MAEAVFGLIGVVVGGLLTAGADYVARRAAARQARRLAARVLYDELANVRASVRWSMKNRNPALSFPEKLELSATWREYRRDLGSVGWDVWAAVDHAVASLETTTPATQWSAGREEWFTTLESDTAAAMEALGRYVK